MHRVIKSHLANFVKNFSLNSHDESEQFERFAAYSIIANRFNCDIDFDDIITSRADDGIDAIAIIIDESVISSPEEANDIFNSHRRTHDVEIIFIQAKTSEKFDLGDFLKFKESVIRFVEIDENYTVEDEVLSCSHEIFKAIMKNVSKIRNGIPSMSTLYVTTGTYNNPREIEQAACKFKKQVEDLGLFKEVECKFIGRDELTSLWASTYSEIETSIVLHSYAPLPKIDGIDQAYLAVAKAEDLVKNLLTTEEGNLRTQVFEENIRAYLGSDNPVNKSIADTIRSRTHSRFPVLNNGITIASPSIRVQGSILHLKNYSIVNGCQTSNVLFENKDHLKDIFVNIKVVQTTLEEVFSDLVKATNSQTKVENEQFLSLRPVVKKIEEYFNTYGFDENRLYLERRDRQYVGKEIPNVRIFSLQKAVRCVAAMICGRPDLSSRYPKQMYEELGDKILADNTKEVLFYASCMTMYRFTLLIANASIPQNMQKFKWHILALIWVMENGNSLRLSQLSSKTAEGQAKKVLNIMKKHDKKTTDLFKKAAAICAEFGDATRDKLKTQNIFREMVRILNETSSDHNHIV